MPECETLVTDAPPEIPPSVLAAARRGDPVAFATILDAYDARLRALTFRVLCDVDLMDDAMQDAALKAYRAMRSFRGDADIGTWLYRITYTTCIDRLRSRAPVMVPLAEMEDGRSTDGAPTRSAECCDADLAEDVIRRLEVAGALANLSPAHRVTVLLVLEQGYDLKTAGQVMGVPEGTVASRLFHAKAALRRSLRPASLVEEDR
jgi:RNA polymerase sigma-70 factor, ECF subfamily